MKYNVGDTVVVHVDGITSYRVEIIKILDEDTYQVLEVLPTGDLDWLYGELYDDDENHYLDENIG